MNETLKILVLEDTKSDVDLLIRELTKSEMNFEHQVVQTRENYENALRIFQPDIVLSDYTLPAFDGISAFHLQQEIRPEIPFLIVSGTIGEENAVKLIKYGITDCIQKDRLFTAGQKILRALKETREKNEKRLMDEKLKAQNEKLMEIAFLQSHQIRRPVADILGLISMFNTEDPADSENREILTRLEKTAVDLDSIIRDIVQRTSEIE